MNGNKKKMIGAVWFAIEKGTQHEKEEQRKIYDYDE